jgi:hypothetical protein
LAICRFVDLDRKYKLLYKEYIIKILFSDTTGLDELLLLINDNESYLDEKLGKPN